MLALIDTIIVCAVLAMLFGILLFICITWIRDRRRSLHRKLNSVLNQNSDILIQLEGLRADLERRNLLLDHPVWGEVDVRKTSEL